MQARKRTVRRGTRGRTDVRTCARAGVFWRRRRRGWTMQVHGCFELRTCCIRGGTASCPRGWASRAVRPPLAPPRLRWTASHACSWIESLTARHRCGSHALVRCMDARSSTWTRCGHARRSVLVLVCLWRDGRWGSVHGRTSTCGSGPNLLPLAPAWHAIVHVAHRPSCKVA